MTSKTFITFAILAALCLSSVSADVSCDCDWLETNINTVNSLRTSSFQISSINLNNAYIPSDINSACGNIGAFAQVEATSEERAVSRKGSKAAFALAADDYDEPSSFLERTQTTVTATDVTNALEFDTYCVETIGSDASVDPYYLSNTQAYCKNPLRAYFSGTYFPNSKGKDNTNDRQYYESEANSWYTVTVYNYLNCTF
jgi:hypothetical protein